jgi:pyruvate,water dikinase
LAQPRFLTITLPQAFRTAPERLHRARARYAEVADRWGRVPAADAPAVRLLAGVREITEQGAQYYLSIQGGVLPAAYTSE